MTEAELRELTSPWFTGDPQDAPEIAVAGAAGRYAAVFDFFRKCGGSIRAGTSFWDPVAKRDVALESVANPGEAADAGHADSFVAEFEGLHHAGVELPSVMVWTEPPGGLQIFWECGPRWERPMAVASFFDLLAQLEQQVGVRLDFTDETGAEPVGPRLGELYAQWLGSDGHGHEGASSTQSA